MRGFQDETRSTNHSQIIKVAAAAQRGPSDCWRRGCRLGGRGDQRQFFSDFQACLAHKLCDHGSVEARSIVLDAECARPAIEAELPDAVHVSGASQRLGNLLVGGVVYR